MVSGRDRKISKVTNNIIKDIHSLDESLKLGLKSKATRKPVTVH